MSFENAFLIYYFVYNYRLRDRTSYKYSRFSTESSSGRQVVSELEAWVQYQVVVRAYNTNGEGPISAPVLVRTHEDGEI